MGYQKLTLTIGYLYADLMNIYGDIGNIITIQKRCQWRGIQVQVKKISIGNKIKLGDIDLYFFGGGQDESQIRVAKDLQSKKHTIIQDIERGVPLLSICGGYQLLGNYYRPQNGAQIKGLGIFPIYTKAGDKRRIGNILIESHLIPENSKLTLVGFENHSGKTYLEENAIPLGKLIKGFGNNGEDKTEGCVYKNAIGCYMHGSLLPKNPKLADYLIQKALDTKYKKEILLDKLDDSLEELARESAIEKFS